MGLLSAPRTIIDTSLSLARGPLEAALKAGGVIKPSVAEKERERAQRLRAEAEQGEKEAAQTLAEEAERARSESAKLDRAARLQEVEARAESLAAKEAAVRAEREAKRTRAKAAKAKKARKSKSGGSSRKGA